MNYSTFEAEPGDVITIRVPMLAFSKQATEAYDEGFAAGYAKANLTHVPPQEVLSKAAGYLDANQLPLVPGHESEALLRRRVTAFLRELAAQPEFSVRAAVRAIEATG